MYAALIINLCILVNAYLYRGRVFYKLGDKIKACQDWSKSGELGSEEAYKFISQYCQ